jgi:Mn2+/Fe2+ NRAMP family transporter
MTLDNTVGILIGTLIVLAFLILGAELLGPEGLVPEEQDVAQVLGRLLGDVWGNFGYWFMVVGVLIGFWNTTMTNQDGWARLFADGLAIYTRKTGWGERWKDEDFLKKVVLVVLLTLAPAALFIFRGRPVGLLQLAGVIEAIQIPILAGLVLYLNRRILPKELRPSGLSFWLTIIAALFFAAFAVFHLGRLVGLFGGGAGGGGATPTPGPGTPTPTPGA